MRHLNRFRDRLFRLVGAITQRHLQREVGTRTQLAPDSNIATQHRRQLYRPEATPARYRPELVFESGYPPEQEILKE